VTTRNVSLRFEPDGLWAKVEPGTLILDALRTVGLSIRSECGGRGICGKCRVILQTSEGTNEPTVAERSRISEADLAKGYRLACQCRIYADNTIIIPDESRLAVRRILIQGVEGEVTLDSPLRKVNVTLPHPTLSDVRSDFQRLSEFLREVYNLEPKEVDFEVMKEAPRVLRDAEWNASVTLWEDKIISIEPGDTTNTLLGIAIDIGTSKIIGYLSDLLTGELLNVGFIENPQISHGEDVISRLSYASRNPEALRELQQLAIKGVNSVISDACKESACNPDSIYEVTVVGNTAMHHLFLGLTPKFLGLSPYVPVISDSVNLEARTLGVRVNPAGNVHILPVIAGFVGADAVADIIATGIYESNELSLVVDIGTNTEVILGRSGDLISASCASGPAFEGAQIKCGMKAVTGAIERVKIEPRSLKVDYVTIGDSAPVGICGSGIVDGVAELLRNRIIDRTGRMVEKVDGGKVRSLGKEREFLLVAEGEGGARRDIVISQKDVREIQLAKAAIYTGCSILMKKKGVTVDDIEHFYIAGAFGNYLNPENAKFLGMFPEISTDKIKFVGNAAGAGARMALLSREVRRVAAKVAREVGYVELALEENFQKEFASAMYFPHKDLDRFPSTKAFFLNDTSRVI